MVRGRQRNNLTLTTPFQLNNNCIIAEEELAAERAKLYEAIGYSESAKVTAYSAEVCVYTVAKCTCIYLMSACQYFYIYGI